jgi:excinuclease ABC subunit A
MTHSGSIRITGASEHNLRSVSLEIPKNKLTVVTGVSGSGKSSLIFDVLYREAETRYLGSFSSHARQFLGKIRKPAVEKIEGIPPAIAVQQDMGAGSIRSTVGTITGLYDHLRLLFARTGRVTDGDAGFRIDRSLFSFNTPSGACPGCKGLGVSDRLDIDLLIADPGKTLRQGALSITTPNGYIIYSQVTMEVLDQVCRAEGFNVDIPWKELTPEQQYIVLYGSDRVEIPYGKHPLESRMRWSGITAKPREMGTYKGILPVMEAILKRDRNRNILRFVRTGTCPECNGSRLNPQALSVTVSNRNIAFYSSLELTELAEWAEKTSLQGQDSAIAAPILASMLRRIGVLKRLGLGYLTCARDTVSLSGGESRRLKLASQAFTGLSGILYIFDEPSVGLHPRDTEALIGVLKELRDQGNTVIVVEHDEEFIRHADHLVDIGPGPGIHGGEVLLSIPAQEAFGMPSEKAPESRTLAFLNGRERIPVPEQRRTGAGELTVSGASARNLKEITVHFLLEALNVVTGVSGAGKTTLVQHVLGDTLRKELHHGDVTPGPCREITGSETITKVIGIDQSPIGRTPRSNPATYTGLFDHIRDLFASQPEAVARGYGKGRFSFNTEGGRCPACEGAGYLQVGMHFMGNVEIPCETCEGKRFDAETLEVEFRGKNIYEILEMPVAAALEFFTSEPRIRRYLETLASLGLGYLTLGQRSSTLSGGEAQRVKLAAELAKPFSPHTLYILDEPTTGLHNADVVNLLAALDRLTGQGHTVILTEHHPALVLAADRVIDLGPGSGKEGGNLIYEGPPIPPPHHITTPTHHHITRPPSETSGPTLRDAILLEEVTTNNLQSIDVAIPHGKVTVITGVSGSGKSSLAFDTIHAESRNRFLESFSPYVRSMAGVREQADFGKASGLTASLAVGQGAVVSNPRSTVGTLTGIHDLYRLLYSRAGVSLDGSKPGLSSQFSYNHQHGACPVCKGLGFNTKCDPDRLITDPALPLTGGALDGTKTGRFYGDPYGQYVATLLAVGQRQKIDFTVPWSELNAGARHIAIYGTGDEEYDVNWEYKRDKRTGSHRFRGRWAGFTGLVEEEYERKHADHRGEAMMGVMMQVVCPACRGSRLNETALSFRVNGLNIAELSLLDIPESIGFFNQCSKNWPEPGTKTVALPLVEETLRRLELLPAFGLGYLTVSRTLSSLSSGEARRIRLAAQLGTGLSGVTYVLDEPTLGLHPNDTRGLIEKIHALKEAGNTVIVVEHDTEVIRSADHIIELGPGAGSNGGRIIASGSLQSLVSDPNSVTGPFLLAGRKQFTGRNRQLASGIRIEGASANNLKGIDLEIPAGGIILITGVSGSGKSSLLSDVVHESFLRNKPSGCRSITGFEKFREVISAKARSGSSSSTSVPATFTGIFDRIRTIFAKSEEALEAGLTKNHFSFMNREGQCPDCGGTGEVRISMDFLSDLSMPCGTCNGKRYNESVLRIRSDGRNIYEVLEMSFTEASEFFKASKVISGPIALMERVGLGYLKLGQPLDTLSGGEFQRMALATELMRPEKTGNLYLFDEPTAGLHPLDIRYLMRLFHDLADNGHTLYIIEHDPEVIRQADHVIDLGPGAGDKGGRIVASGLPEQLADNPNSLTGKYLSAF